MSDTPSNDDLRAIKRALPGLLGDRDKYRYEHDKETLRNGAGKFCAVCTSEFKIKSSDKQFENLCSECISHLQKGGTCLVCSDGRWARVDWDSPDNNYRGLIVKIPVTAMDNLTAKHNSENPDKNGDPENN